MSADTVPRTVFLFTVLFGTALIAVLSFGQWSQIKTIGPIVSLLILIAMTLSLIHSRRMDSARAALADSEARARQKSRELQLTLEHMAQGIIMVDGDGEIVVINDKAVALLDPPEPVNGHRLQFDDIVEHMLERGEFRLVGGFGNGGTMQQVRSLPPGLDSDYYERKRPDGTVLAIDSRRMPDGGFVRTITDITERYRSAEKIAHLAHHDTLTNLANRSLFRERLSNALVAINDNGGFGLILIDLDGFKDINDTYGHEVGDGVLRLAALRLRAAVRSEDIIGRLGGDEFGILLRGITDSKLLLARAQHLVDLLREPYVVDDLLLTSSASIGVVVAPKDGQSVVPLLRNAYTALYLAKANGRNRCRSFAPEMSGQLVERLGTEKKLYQADTNGDSERSQCAQKSSAPRSDP